MQTVEYDPHSPKMCLSLLLNNLRSEQISVSTKVKECDITDVGIQAQDQHVLNIFGERDRHISADSGS